MIRFLVSRGANVEARDKEGKTAIMRVAEGHYARNHATVEGNMAALLEAGANIDAVDAKGRTALMNAAIRSAYEEDTFDIISFLLKRKANPHMRDPQGNNAAMLAQAALAPVDTHRLAGAEPENPDDQPQLRVARLLARVCVEQHKKIEKDCVEGIRKKIGVRPPLRLKPGRN
jgi:ankyrin repeat protein